MDEVTFCTKCDRPMYSDSGPAVCISCQPHKFTKQSLTGWIRLGHIPGKGGGYLADVGKASKWYKTYRGAAAYMEKLGYKRVKGEK